MARAPGVAVPFSEAESTRRQLTDEGQLRADLHPLKTEEGLVFPVLDGAEEFEFLEREQRPNSYQSLLPERLADVAPRAFESMGDIAIVKIPAALWGDRVEIGTAMQSFLGARAVFHDGGVKGTFRVRELQRLVGTGTSETRVQENGVRLHVDVGRAYFSPRLAEERSRVAGLVKPGEQFVDLFGGVAPLAVQAAKAGANVTCVDLNPDAIDLAIQNAKANRVEVRAICQDARVAAHELPPADRIVMNLPHGAKDFLADAHHLAKPGGMIHHHEILPNDDVPARIIELSQFGEVENSRHVRNYSASESHVCFDIRVSK